MTAEWPAGLITPLVTPMAGDALDLGPLRSLVERQIDAGAGGVLVGGGTGEHGALSLAERRDVAEAVAALTADRLPFFVQTGALATRDCLALTRHAEEVGAAGVLVASPFGEPISWAERRRFYEDVVGATGLPVMLYNTPPAGIMQLEQVQELAALPNVTAIKDSSGDVTLLGDLLEWAAAADVAVYVGFDSIVPFAVTGGARGALVGTGNLIPHELVATIRMCLTGDEAFSAVWPTLRAFLRFMEDSSNYVAMCKAGLELDGLGVGAVRPPYLMPGADERRELAARLGDVRQTFGRTGATAVGV